MSANDDIVRPDYYRTRLNYYLAVELDGDQARATGKGSADPDFLFERVNARIAWHEEHIGRLRQWLEAARRDGINNGKKL